MLLLIYSLVAHFSTWSYEYALPTTDVSLQVYSPQGHPIWLFYLSSEEGLKEYTLELERGFNRVNIPEEVQAADWAIIKYRDPKPTIWTVFNRRRQRLHSTISNSHHLEKAAGQLKVANLSALDNIITIHHNGESQEYEIRGHRSLTLSVSGDTQIESQYRTSAVVESESALTWPQSNIQPPPTGTGFFEVGNPDEPHLSYIAKIEDPELLAKARNLLKNPDENYKVVSAKIELGSKNNMNLKSESNYQWSWHVSKVLGLYDLASQKCNGDPLLVEDYLEHWTQDIGIICFWSYRLIREL